MDDFTSLSDRIKKSINKLINKIEIDQTENKKETGEIKIKLDRSNKNVELINEKLNNLDEKFSK